MRARRPWMLPLVPLYAAGSWMERRWFAPTPRRLRWPVVCVGSLSAGGAGKTPVVEALARLLQQNGYAVDVLSRGYGRAATTVARVQPDGTAEEFGDEPLLLAKRTGAPVYVGADRYAAGQMAEQGIRSRQKIVHLLDDGLQHHRLHRDLEIALLTREDVSDCLLPAGNLREPLRRLRQVDVIVVREKEAAELQPVLEKAAKEVWVIRRSLDLPTERPSHPLAFCGIARPQDFFSSLREAGMELAGTVAFRDHHVYEERDMRRLREEADRRGANGLITTEKDAVRISATMRLKLETEALLAVAGVRVSFRDEEEILRRIGGLVGPSCA